jgi:hypothetical protein
MFLEMWSRSQILVAHLWPLILAIQEAEIRRIVDQSQPGQIVYRPISKNPSQKKGWWNGSRWSGSRWSGSRCRLNFQTLVLEKKRKRKKEKKRNVVKDYRMPSYKTSCQWVRSPCYTSGQPWA